MYKTEQREYEALAKMTKLVVPGVYGNRKARRFKINDPNFTKKRHKR